ncbi:iron-containing redox enzyme family protein [Parafrankia sp. FMc6]|uniref:TenA family transcriptional regulator n=1 Tax=Parafrankia soli TaxID=2599596 RepID=UPI0034D3C9E5
MTTTGIDPLNELLTNSPVHRGLDDHPFFRRLETRPLTVGAVAVLLGQWWHPLHYFPTFLARCAAVLPDIASKSAVVHILNQETGDGDAARAHEVIYVDTMERAGFDPALVTAAQALPETVALLAGYERASATETGARGFIFATEVTDLRMVSGIGAAVERAAGNRDLEWVRIHVEQEPDHVDDASRAVFREVDDTQARRVIDAAEQMWRLWTAFFDRLDAELAAPLPERDASPAARR